MNYFTSGEAMKNFIYCIVLSLTIALSVFLGSGQNMISSVSAQEVVQELSSENEIFSDNFDNGIKKDWISVSGKWKMINGQLRPMSGDPAILKIGGKFWTDYSIEFDYYNLKNDARIRLGVRNDDISKKSYMASINYYDSYCFLENGEEDEIYVKSGSWYTKSGKLKIVLEGEIIKMFRDGDVYCTVSDDTLKQGNVVLEVVGDGRNNPPYPIIDNFVVSKNN